MRISFAFFFTVCFLPLVVYKYFPICCCCCMTLMMTMPRARERCLLFWQFLTPIFGTRARNQKQNEKKKKEQQKKCIKTVTVTTMTREDKTRHASACTFRFDVVSSIKERGLWGGGWGKEFAWIHCTTFSGVSLTRSVSHSSFVIMHSCFPLSALLSN